MESEVGKRFWWNSWNGI